MIVLVGGGERDVFASRKDAEREALERATTHKGRRYRVVDEKFENDPFAGREYGWDENFHRAHGNWSLCD